MLTSSTPISPPVTPKSVLREHVDIPEDAMLQLPVTAYVPSIDLRRKSNARRYSRAMATADKDAITFSNPFALEGQVEVTASAIKSHRSKSIPRRSPSPSTRGSFTMDFVGLGNVGTSELSRKRRNSNTTEPMVTPNQPTFNTTSILNTERHVKKSKTDAAAAYDRVDINMSDKDAFQNPQWIPDMNVFHTLPAVRVVWKGSPLDISQLPYYDTLHPGEVNIASTLRLTPEQYLKCKRSLILAAEQFDKLDISFRKSDAQKCVRIDVNKTSTLWSVFSRLGWFNPRSA
ncbi:Homeodomain-like protein [Mucor mucedo]|uniref:Homeodomain-like protein n=1 Tax=Mucor mucedo TaxID=29922 RepID=UPI002220A780|nr:Homeodomain-like protein [Mucor mucedo]KAI7881193.1 Homeodomain-like protein [Mucor mucedo]